MKFLKILGKFGLTSTQVVFFIFSLVVILVASYILGGNEFMTKGVWGTDIYNAFTIAEWVDKYFPKIPFWYPYAGGGVSLSNSYPMLAFYLASALKRLTDITLTQSVLTLGYSSVVVMAIGIYAFVTVRFKSQLLALLSSILFLISPFAWTYLTDWGFYSEVVSYLFVPWAILFWDLYYFESIKEKPRNRLSVYLFFGVVFFTLTLITHMGSGMGLVGLYLFYVLANLFTRKRRSEKLSKGLVSFAVLVILSVLLSLFVTLPFYRYSRIASFANLGNFRSFGQIKEATLDYREVLSLKPGIVNDPVYGTYYSAYRNISFPQIVAILALAGIIVSFLNKRLLAFSLLAVFSVFVTTNVNYFYWVVNKVPYPLHAPFVWRWIFVPLKFVIPILAVTSVMVLYNFITKNVKRKHLVSAGSILVAITTLTVGLFLVVKFGHLPKPEGEQLNFGARGFDPKNIFKKEEIISLKTGIDTYSEFYKWIDLCAAKNTCNYLGDEACLENYYASKNDLWCESYVGDYFPALSVRGWCEKVVGVVDMPVICSPQTLSKSQAYGFWKSCDANEVDVCKLRYLSVNDQFSSIFKNGVKLTRNVDIEPWFRGFLEDIKSADSKARIDFSPYLPKEGMLAPMINVDSSLSQIYIYTVSSSSLMQKYIGPQINAMYLGEVSDENIEYAKNTALWFGTEYLFVEDRSDRDLLYGAGYELYEEKKDDNDQSRYLLKSSLPNYLAEVSNKPKILVISDSNASGWDQVYFVSLFGAIPYDSAYIVQSEKGVEKFSAKDLASFDAILLQGYSYKNKNNTDALLKEYVEGGGSVFIDTGWQFTVPDWETEKGTALEILPFNKMEWKELSQGLDFSLNDDGLEVNVESFSPLTYGGGAWGVSTGTSLRPNYSSVISYEGYPLIARGNIGQGKVVWSGMNIFSHVKQGADVNGQEIKLLSSLFDWLLERKGGDIIYEASYERVRPDEVVFEIDESVSDSGSILWKEAYHPDFSAYRVSRKTKEKLETYRAGPGMTLITFSDINPGEKIVYKYNKHWSDIFSIIISVVALIFLITATVLELATKKPSPISRLTAFLEKKTIALLSIWKRPLEWWGKDNEQ